METARVAQRIRSFRKLKGYTQQELARELDISLGILGSVERGVREPDDWLLQRIALILNVEVDEIKAERRR